MFPTAGETAGPNRLNFFREPRGVPGVTYAKQIKKKIFSFFLIIFSFFFPRATPVISANILYNLKIVVSDNLPALLQGIHAIENNQLGCRC